MTDTEALKKMSSEILRQQQLLTDYSNKFDKILSQVEQHLGDNSAYSVSGLAVGVVSLSMYLLLALFLMVIYRRKIQNEVRRRCCCPDTEFEEGDIEESVVSIKPEKSVAYSTVIVQDETFKDKDSFIPQYGDNSKGVKEEGGSSVKSKSVKKESIRKKRKGRINQKNVKAKKKGKRTGKEKPDQPNVVNNESQSRVRFDDSQSHVDTSSRSVNSSDESSSSEEEGPVPENNSRSKVEPPKVVDDDGESSDHSMPEDETVLEADREGDLEDRFRQKGHIERDTERDAASNRSRQQLNQSKASSLPTETSEPRHTRKNVDPKKLEFSSSSEEENNHQFVPRHVSTQRNEGRQPAKVDMHTVSAIGPVPRSRSFQTLATNGSSNVANLSWQSYQPAVPQPRGNDISSVPIQPMTRPLVNERRQNPGPSFEQGGVSSSADPGRSGEVGRDGGGPACEVDSDGQDSFHPCYSGEREEMSPPVQSMDAVNRVRTLPFSFLSFLSQIVKLSLYK